MLTDDRDEERRRAYRRETFWLVVLAIAWIAFLQCAPGCSTPKPAPLPPQREAELVTPWCVAGVADLHGEETDLRVCVSTESVCQWIHDQVEALGYPVLSLGECEER